ncbi:MAG TPA: hypothetical protein PK297_14690 [Spirochaetota bacterium]|nr:hypothetical protein [Spirochaetota bacterium]
MSQYQYILNLSRLSTALLTGALLLLAACSSGEVIGTPAPAETVPTALSDILERPADFEGKTVVLRGQLSAQCKSLCDFTYTEKSRSATVFMGDLKPPRIRQGQQLRVTAKIHKGNEQVVLTATGLELVEGKAEGDKNETRKTGR